MLNPNDYIIGIDIYENKKNIHKKYVIDKNGNIIDIYLFDEKSQKMYIYDSSIKKLRNIP